MSPQTATAAADKAGLAHARALREARERQLALIAIAAGNAAACRPPAAAPAATPVPPRDVAALDVADLDAAAVPPEERRIRAQIRRLGICRPVDPDAPARSPGKVTPPAS